MVILFGLFGLLAGWLVNLASDTLPRFVTLKDQTPATALKFYPPALLNLALRRVSGRWGWLHLTIELVSSLFFMLMWSQVGFTPVLLVLVVGYVFLLLVAVIDVKYRLILNVMIYPAILIALGVQLLVLRQNPTTVLMGGVFAFSIFFLTAWLKPGEVGGGDVKLALLIGITFGFPSVLWALLIGAAVSAVVIVYMLHTRRGNLKTGIPYAPFLCVGAMALLLYHPMMFQ